MGHAFTSSLDLQRPIKLSEIIYKYNKLFATDLTNTNITC